MEEVIKTMTYQEFKAFCNKRASDGRWNNIEIITCLNLIEKIDKIKVKGLFKRKATEKAREAAFNKIKEEL